MPIRKMPAHEQTSDAMASPLVLRLATAPYGVCWP